MDCLSSLLFLFVQVVVFCRLLNWSPLATIIQSYSKRLYFGVKEELLPLVRISAELLPGCRARALYGCGLRSPEDVVRCNRLALVRILLDIIPYESADPLVGSRQRGRPEPAEAASAPRTDRGKEHLANRLACENLAGEIMAK